ncbi:hypothetical protein GIB67_016016 [Kingdonia uniflora]|uniref:B-like cyclin n=1 Tax=Kingdonia uniflora TaxID=39325 RepID=A0A7J7L1P6_9MAGN|nr:hypothetical protein GIB67_016016 [Kingdonia uniflora]
MDVKTIFEFLNDSSTDEDTMLLDSLSSDNNIADAIKEYIILNQIEINNLKAGKSFGGRSGEAVVGLSVLDRELGKSNVNRLRVLDDQRTAKNVGVREFKVYSESIDGDGSKTATKPHIAAVQSVKQKDSAILKCVDENLGKGRNKLDVSDKLRVGRKVLADVSNVKKNLSRNRGTNGSVPMVSARKCGMDGNLSSRRPVMGSVKTNQSRGVEDLSSIKNVKAIYFKDFPANQKAKGHGSYSFGSEQRKISRKPLLPIRQSLPVVRRDKPAGSSDLKGSVGRSEKGTGSTVKIKVGRKVVPDLSSCRNHIRKGHASGGFGTLNIAEKPLTRTWVPGGQGIVDRSALLKKSLKPLRRSTRIGSTVQTLKSKSTLCSRKSIPATAASSKFEEGLVDASDKSLTVVVSRESSAENLPSNDNMLGIMSRTTKCSRRRSFTSSLIVRYKIPRECVNHEKLPVIDNISNHLEVAEYIDDIYQYYWALEVHLKFGLMQETLFLMVALFDRFLSVNTIRRNEMQLVGLTSLLLASKYEDLWHPKVKELISLSGDSCTRDKILAMEKLILKKLMFRLNTPTLYVFMLRFLKAAQSVDKKLGHLAFYLIELCLVEYEALTFKPSLLCASAIYVARCTLGITPAWTPLLRKHAHYEESQVRACANMILRLQKSAGRGPFKVTYEKFNHSDFNCVAEIKALEKLPPQ